MARQWCQLLIWSQTSKVAATCFPSPRLCPRRSPTLNLAHLDPRVPVSPSPPLQEKDGTCMLYYEDGRKGSSFWAREINVPARKYQSGPLGNGASSSSSRREPVMLWFPSAAPLFSGVFPGLKQSNVVSRYACGSWWGLALKPLPTQSFHPCRRCPKYALPYLSTSGQ